MSKVKIGNRYIGDNEKVFIIAEIGINHNGSLRLAKRLIKEAFQAGAEVVKDQWYIERETPWGRMTYIDYRFKVELSLHDYSEIDRYCKKLGLMWTASCWDEDSVDFIEQFDVPFYKAASASLTDQSLFNKKRSTGKPIMISTGMSTLKEIKDAVKFLGNSELLMHIHVN